ncbi:MAG TPA: glycosyltransferase family 4 protein [Gemmatimonadaceae bacterium]|nr:glycosyltransferase family 4 protein [Gemmatimonadaceae bacterium]
MRDADSLRVALVAGTLTLGGAEKQLVYMARALRDAGVTVHVLSLTRGEHFERALRAEGLVPRWIGRHASPPLRMLALAAALRDFHPHIVQAGHFYTNLYVALAARAVDAISIGAIRNDTWHELEGNGRWGRALLRAPAALIANSYAAKRNAERVGLDASAVHVVPNVIDLAEPSACAPQDGPSHAPSPRTSEGDIMVAGIARLVPAKRFDRFLAALALARREVRTLTGVIGGDGPERDRLQMMAASRGLFPAGVRFVGAVDASALLHRADMLLVTSEHEGFPNVILEAMAAGRPVITTPAGDAGVVVEDDATGYVVPFDDVSAMAERMVRLARSPRLRGALGAAGRARVERCYSFDRLAASLLDTYRDIAEHHHHRRVCDALAN